MATTAPNATCEKRSTTATRSSSTVVGLVVPCVGAPEPQHGRDQQGEPAQPHAHPRQVDDVGDERERHQVARHGVAGEADRDQQARPPATSHGPGQRSAPTGRAAARRRRARASSDEPHHPRPAGRVPSSSATRRVDGVGQRAADGVGALQGDGQHRGHQRGQPGHGHDAPGPAVAAPGRPQPGQEDDGPDQHGEAGEGREPHDAVDGTPSVWSPSCGPAEHVVDQRLVVDRRRPGPRPPGR